MRLHHLAIQAFGPYAARQEIDFDRLTSSGLFLLEGPTGVGKTTILDAVTFALYGGLAGEDSGQDRMHSHFADPGVEPEVSLEFSLRGVRHKITRSPEYLRPKLRGEGFTTQAMKVHLQRADSGGGWESRSSNKAEVAEMVGEAIGLSRDQFTQVMLLPQGEFARFLRSDDDARRTVLTKIFGTQLFDRITAELDRRRAQAVRDRQAAEADIAAAVAAAAEAAGLDGDQRDELLALRPEERAVRLKQISEEQDALAALAEQGRELTADQSRVALSAERQATARSELMRRLTGALAALEAHEASRAEHAERVASLDAARRAGPVRPLLAVLADAESGTAAAREQVRQAVAEAAGQAGAATAIADVAAAGQAEEFAEAARLADGADRDLVVNAAARAADRAAEGLRAAAGLEHLVAAEAALPAAEEAAAELDRVAAASAAEVGSLETARRDLPAEIAGLEAELIGARAAAAALEAASQRQRDLASLERSAARLAEIGPLLAAADERRRAAVDAHQRLVDAHQQAMDARLAGMSGELASGLVAGQPCPVCGSAEHPAPAPAGADPVTEETVAAARERRDEAQRARELAEREHASLDREAAECAARLGGQTMTDLTEQAAAAAAAVAAGEEAVLLIARLEPELTGLRDRLDRLGDDLMAATERRSAAQRDAELKRAELAGRRAEVAQAAAGHPSVAARQTVVRVAAAADQALAEALGRLADALSAERQARQRAESEALASGFGGQDAGPAAGPAALALARSAVLAPDRQADLDLAVTGWNTRLDELKGAVGAPELAGLDPADAGAAHAAAEQAAARLEAARAAEQEALAACSAQRDRVHRLAARQAEVRAAQDAAAALIATTSPVIYLAGLAKGMEGRHRMALTTFVLRHWFEQVVAAANVRLSVMSSGRYELRRSDESENRRQRTGLTLAVIDRHTGEERSPKSLSGGETFYTSLALALGLADVVKAEAGGVDLETLFIDEGFGSLDDQTLDQVLGVIDELRDRGRAVGIVSHVADLKDRVAERLEVRRLPDGSSAARVVA